MNIFKQASYLTIDDAPSKVFKEKVDILKRKNIPAIFFCRGDRLQHFMDTAIYAIKNGFILANHAYSHRYFSSLSLKECKEEIYRTDMLLSDIYEQANVKMPLKLFRFPYGDKGISQKLFLNVFRISKKFREIQEYLSVLGYCNIELKGYKKRFPLSSLLNDRDVYWTFDVMEWIPGDNIYSHKLFGVDRMIERIDKNISHQYNEIILIHDHENTHLFFEPIINKLSERGLEFILPS